MKKLLLTAFAAALLPSLALAQGTVNFGSVPTGDPQGPYQRLWVQSTGAPAASGSEGQLWWSPDNVVAFTSITPWVPASATGRITTGAVVATTGAATAGGANAWFKVYGRNLGLDIYGNTIAFNSPTATPLGNPPPTPPYLTGWDASVGQVLMSPVPEPSTIALAGLGLASLLAFRRRK